MHKQLMISTIITFTFFLFAKTVHATDYHSASYLASQATITALRDYTILLSSPDQRRFVNAVFNNTIQLQSIICTTIHYDSNTKNNCSVMIDDRMHILNASEQLSDRISQSSLRLTKALIMLLHELKVIPTQVQTDLPQSEIEKHKIRVDYFDIKNVLCSNGLCQLTKEL